MVVAENNYEQEAKFYIANLPALESKLKALEASLKIPGCLNQTCALTSPTAG